MRSQKHLYKTSINGCRLPLLMLLLLSLSVPSMNAPISAVLAVRTSSSSLLSSVVINFTICRTHNYGTHCVQSTLALALRMASLSYLPPTPTQSLSSFLPHSPPSRILSPAQREQSPQATTMKRPPN